MNNLPQIVDNATQMTFLGGGPVDPLDLDRALSLAPVLVAADGGANFALGRNIDPHLVVGDLDSVDTEAIKRADVPVVHISDQNSTDLEKCLSVTQSKVVLGVGFLGGRLDHELASLNAISRLSDRAMVLIGQEDIVFRVPPKLTLGLRASVRVSVFPMTECQAKSVGLVWGLDGLQFSPNGQIGCSNKADRDTVTIEILSGDMLMILPKSYLAAAIDGLCDAFGLSRLAG